MPNFKFIWIVFAIFCAVFLSAPRAWCAGPANALSIDLINSLLSKSDAKLILTKSLFLISQKVEQDLSGRTGDAKTLTSELNLMVKDLSRRIGPKDAPEIIVATIADYLFNEKGFTVDRSKLFESSLDSLLINRAIENKTGQCLSLSLIYLILAERLHLPVHGVMVPNHFFVRYDDGNQRVNIETTDNGKSFDDSYYLQFYLKGFNDRVSLRNLTKKETIAVYLNNLANHYKLQGDHEKAMAIFKSVIDIMPESASLYVNLGNTYERDGQFLKAIVSYHKALSLNPYICEAHYNLGLAHFIYTGRADDALRHGEIARQLGCRIHPEFKAFLDKQKQ